jgi:hypothetical protein
MSLTGVAGAGTRPPEVQYFSGSAAEVVWGACRQPGADPDRGASCLVRVADRGRVLEPEEKGGTPAKSPLAADVPVR